MTVLGRRNRHSGRSLWLSCKGCGFPYLELFDELPLLGRVMLCLLSEVVHIVCSRVQCITRKTPKSVCHAAEDTAEVEACVTEEVALHLTEPACKHAGTGQPLENSIGALGKINAKLLAVCLTKQLIADERLNKRT